MKIKKILIANRGEIAVRILKTCHKLNIPSVVIYHAADANSPAIKLAEETVEIKGTTPVSAYLNIDAIIDACQSCAANAVHPGFGFLAENGEFARRLEAENIIFIGPQPEVIDLMGNKISARSFAIKHNVPIVPSTPHDDNPHTFIENAIKIGFPLLLKAAAGGGGKGMTIVHKATELEAAITLTSNEASRAFGDGTLYAEKYVEQPRHIEVQILADAHGNVIHLGERECSIQRRFQKVVEEAPSPILSPELRTEMCKTAVTIAKQANYQNAGTVEFILSPDNKFYFLEMNTRLQVEHPVTELVTGIDLVAEQINVANGELLSFTQADIKVEGHAIECRIYAEDAENEFAPTTGPILIYEEPAFEGIRVDSGIDAGMKVTPAFDPMLAKLIAFGTTRDEALVRLERGLRSFVLLGCQTNINWLQALIAHSEFKTAVFHTGFIQEKMTEFNLPQPTEAEKAALLFAVAVQERPFISPEYQPLPLHTQMGGWRN